MVTHRTFVNMGCVLQYYGELIELYRVEHDRPTSEHTHIPIKNT